jgi:chemotaxis protein methyltransferase CheR
MNALTAPRDQFGASSALLGPSDQDRLTIADFDRLASFINDRVGIKMPREKRIMLEGRLRRRVRAVGLPSIADYCAYLFSGDALAHEEEHLINAVTTNKTDFFREPRHFDYMRETALPALVRGGASRIRAWSAAASTGAEAYTIAMLLDAFLCSRKDLEYGILATDIDTEVLETGRRGVYPIEMLDPVPPALRRDYVLESRDVQRQEARMVPHLRAAVGFARLNLMDDHYPVGEQMQLIFCRNVLIYFDKPTQEKVLRRLITCLAPEGYLFLGHSESIAGLSLPLTAVANTIFQRN